MSSNATEQPADFESVKARLAEIADAVDDESLSLDDALDLYEEAVALGLQASDLLESGIIPPEEGDGAGEGDGPDSEGESAPEGEAASGDAPEGAAASGAEGEPSAESAPDSSSAPDSDPDPAEPSN